jgi:integrase
MNTTYKLHKRGRTWHAAFLTDGVRTFRTLKTSDKRVANQRAKEIISGSTPVRAKKTANLDEVVEAYMAWPAAPATKKANTQRLRLICREAGLGDNPSVSMLVRKVVVDWQATRVAGLAGREFDRAARTANSVWRMAKSVFNRRAMAEAIYGELPLTIEGFISTPFLKHTAVTYKRPDGKLMTSILGAADSLLPQDPDAWTAVALASSCGLRAGEIAHARWSWIEGSMIRVQATDEWSPKDKAERSIPIPAHIAARIDSVRTGDRLIAGRMAYVSERVMDWARFLGWDRDKFLHELRKWFGAQVATQAGLYAAQKLLGHSSPDLTASYYADLVDIPQIDVQTVPGVPRAEPKQDITGGAE